MKKIIITVILILSLILTMSACSNNSSGSSTNTSNYKDGTYTGTAQGFKGETTVNVTISGGKIKSVDIVKSSDDKQYLNDASSVIDEIINAQNTDVQAVSGATFSSNGIIDAVKDALSNAST